jgi:outer membrane usher protein
MRRLFSTRAKALLLTVLLAFASFGTVVNAAEVNEDGPTPVLFDVSINGDEQDVTTLVRAADGRIYASRDSFVAWRIRPPAAAPVLFEGQSYYPLDAVKGLRVSESPETQRLSIEAAAEAFESTSLSIGGYQRSIAEAERFGAYLNYDVLAESADRSSLGGLFEGVVFTRAGVGAATAVARLGDDTRLTRLDTSWTFDSTESLASLRIGDSFTRGGVGGTPLRFGGVQWSRNFAVQPNFLTLPLPAVNGSAAAPSVVDVFVNNTLVDRRDLPSGPFELNDLPAVSGAGAVRLVIRDVLGRESSVSTPYYAASQLLRSGLHDYSYEVGFLREGFATSEDEYGELAASMTHRYGVSNSVTAEVHAEATRSQQVVGVSADTLQSGLGVFSVSLAASRSDRHAGGLIALGFERQAGDISFGARGEATTRHYANLGLPAGSVAPSRTVQAFVGAPTRFGALGATYLLRSGRGEPEAQIVSTNASFRLGRFGGLQLTAQRSFSDRKDTTFGLFFTRELGARRSGSASVVSGPYTAASASVQQSLPYGEGFGYRASVERETSTNWDGWAAYQGRSGFYEAEVTRRRGQSGLRLGTAGTLGFMGGNAFAARRLGDSFAQVQVGGVEGVRVYANNQLVGTTDKAGVLLVPQLQSYQANSIRIEAADVPLDFELAEVERRVRPYSRSGVVVRFAARPLAGGLIRIVLDDGSPLPTGAMIRALGSEERFVVAPGGEAYVTGLQPSNQMQASWGEEACSFTILYAESAGPRTSLGTATCTKIPPRAEASRVAALGAPRGAQ